MSDKPAPPEPVLKILRAMLGSAMARCEREGIDLTDFYREFKRLQVGNESKSVLDLFRLTFERLQRVDIKRTGE